MNLRPLGYEPPEPCPAVHTSSHTSHPVSAHTAEPSHRVSGVPAHHTTSYYNSYYGLRVSLTPISITDMKRLPGVDHRELPAGGRPVAGADKRARNRRWRVQKAAAARDRSICTPPGFDEEPQMNRYGVGRVTGHADGRTLRRRIFLRSPASSSGSRGTSTSRHAWPPTRAHALHPPKEGAATACA